MASGFTIAKPRFLYRKWHCTLPMFWNRRSSTSHIINEPIEEELFPDDRLSCFHPTRPGELLDGRFRTIAKLGFGTGSTVWLAENLEITRLKKSGVSRFVSIKIAALDANGSREMEHSMLITRAAKQSDGLRFTLMPIDKFLLRGPRGTHSCLVYKPMRETLLQLQHRMHGDTLSLQYLRLYIFCLLEALDYLHTECHLIHTDIKEDNIMMTFEDDAVLTDFVNYWKANPHPRHVQNDGRIVYLSQDDFGPVRSPKMWPVLSDFNLSFPEVDGGYGHISAIQSHCFRAPEVLLGCPWSYSVDIWNLGLLMWNLLENVTLFDRPAGEDGSYNAHVHLAQMVSLLGDPPKELIKRERICRRHRLEIPVTNWQYKECKSMNEFWGGPFFDKNDKILRPDLLNKGGKKLADTVTELAGEEKEIFLDFAAGMLQWLPEKRKTAAELMQHAIFDQFYENDNE